MNILKIVSEIRLIEPSVRYDFRNDIVKAIAPDKLDCISPIADTIAIQVNDDLDMVIDCNRAGIEISNVDNIEDAVLKIKEFYKSAGEILKWNEIARLGFRVIVVDDLNMSFSSLLGKFKDVFYSKNELAESADDLAIIFDFNKDKNKVKFQVGPMDISQLKILFPRAHKLPDRSVYFDIDFCNVEKILYSNELMETFINSSVEYITEKISQTVLMITK